MSQLRSNKTFSFSFYAYSSTFIISSYELLWDYIHTWKSNTRYNPQVVPLHIVFVWHCNLESGFGIYALCSLGFHAQSNISNSRSPDLYYTFYVMKPHLLTTNTPSSLCQTRLELTKMRIPCYIYLCMTILMLFSKSYFAKYGLQKVIATVSMKKM
jgi:hypothetical protein